MEIYDKVMESLFKDETEFHLGEDSIIKEFYLCIKNGEKVAVISESFDDRTHQYSGLFETNHYDKSGLDICYYKNNVGDSLYGKIGDGLSIPRELILCDDCTAEVFRQVGNVNDRFTLFLSVLESDKEEKSNVRFIVKYIGSFYLTNTVEVWMRS